MHGSAREAAKARKAESERDRSLASARSLESERDILATTLVEVQTRQRQVEQERDTLAMESDEWTALAQKLKTDLTEELAAVKSQCDEEKRLRGVVAEERDQLSDQLAKLAKRTKESVSSHTQSCCCRCRCRCCCCDSDCWA